MKENFEITESTRCCAVCGGLNVERLAWADANTDEVLDETGDYDNSQTWCRDCEDHTGLMFKVEWDLENKNE